MRLLAFLLFRIVNFGRIEQPKAIQLRTWIESWSPIWMFFFLSIRLCFALVNCLQRFSKSISWATKNRQHGWNLFHDYFVSFRFSYLGRIWAICYYTLTKYHQSLFRLCNYIRFALNLACSGARMCLCAVRNAQHTHIHWNDAIICSGWHFQAKVHVAHSTLSLLWLIVERSCRYLIVFASGLLSVLNVFLFINGSKKGK